MTTNQVAMLQMNWRRRTDRAPCEHSNLELEWNERGHSTGRYACSLCGEPMAARPRTISRSAQLFTHTEARRALMTASPMLLVTDGNESS